MNRFSLLLIVLSSASLACGQYVTVTPTQSPAHTSVSITPTIPVTTETELPTREISSSETREWTAQVSRAQIYVRAEAGGDVIGSLKNGDEVTIVRCTTDWCKVLKPDGADWKQGFGWIYKGCLTIESNLGCMMKEE